MSKEEIEIYQSINANKGGRIINKGSTDDVSVSKAEPEISTKIEPETAGEPKNQKSHNDSELSFMTGNDRYDHGCF